MIVVKGSAVVLREEGAEGDIDQVGLHFPGSFVLCHDPSGEYLRPCDFYICRFEPTDISNDRVTTQDVTAAERFYGKATKIREGIIDLPDGSWERMASVTAIGYRRRGDRGGLYKHEYEEAVPLYECKGATRAWRLRLPVSCVADERGFVKP